MDQSLRIILALAGTLLVLYIVLRMCLTQVARRRAFKEVENRIRKGIKPLAREKKGETRYSVVDYEEYVRKTRDRNLKAQGLWLLAQFYHANLHRRKDYVEKALTYYTRIDADFPDHSSHEESLFRLGNLYFFEKFAYSKVCEVYEKLLARYPASKWRNIVKERMELIKNNLDAPGALDLYVLAEKYFEQARYDRCIQCLNEILVRYPQARLCSDALYFLGDIYNFKLKNYNRAIIEYKNLLENFPSGRYAPNAHFKIAECYRKLEMWREAVKEYEKFMKDYGEYGYCDYAQFYIGQCYEKMKDWNEAKNAYILVGKNYPESIWTDVAQSRIKYIDRQLGGA